MKRQAQNVDEMCGRARCAHSQDVGTQWQLNLNGKVKACQDKNFYQAYMAKTYRVTGKEFSL